MLHEEITDKILKCYYTVYNELGYGFLEKVYENALAYELNNYGLICQKQHPIKVYYDKIIVGEYYADLLINDCILIELKSTEKIIEEHEIQLINYLKATKYEVGLLLNFGKKPEIKRKIFTNDRK